MKYEERSTKDEGRKYLTQRRKDVKSEGRGKGRIGGMRDV